MLIVAGYMMSIVVTILGTFFSEVLFSSPKELPLLLRLYPPFCLSRLMYFFTDRCSDNKCIANFSDLNHEMWSCIVILYVNAVLFFIMGLYLDRIIPQEYGIKKNPLFCLKNIFFNRTVKKSTYTIKSPNLLNELEDEDVKNEREYTSAIDLASTVYPLVVKNLRKVYKPVGGKPSKVAVKDFSLHITHGQMLGLLGPNGAGKTSLIAMLTGLYPPDGGSAWIGGYSILTDIDKVHTQMGVCPQFDLLWPDLTVEEHLLFYARIRGVSKQDEKRVVEERHQRSISDSVC